MAFLQDPTSGLGLELTSRITTIGSKQMKDLYEGSSTDLRRTSRAV